MEIPFKTNYVDGDESVMVLDGVSPLEIRFNQKTRAIIIVCEEKKKYPLEDIDDLSWQAIKGLVEYEGGTWTTKTAGIEFLVGVEK